MSVLARSGNWVRELSGWRRAGFAFAAGGVSGLGFAPVEFFPALLLGFAALMLMLDGADEGRAPRLRSGRSSLEMVRRTNSFATRNAPHPMGAGFVSGWAFGFGQFLIGLHWIGYAFLVGEPADPVAHLWQLPFAIVFLSAGLALFAGIAS